MTTAAAVASDLPDRATGGTAARGGRVGNLDVLRAIAALGVVGIHAYTLGGRVVPIKAQYAYDVLLWAGASGVWLFFAISGYVISKPFVDRLLTERPLPDVVPYGLRRALRIYPLYWVALAALIAIDGLGDTRGWQLPFHLALINNLVPGRQEALFPAAWTLTLEVLFYLAVPVAAFALRSSSRRWTPERLAMLVVISWLASIAFTLLADGYPAGHTGLWLRGSLPSMWQMFCPGILLAIAPHLTAAKWRRWVVDRPSHRGALALAAAGLCAAAVLSVTPPIRYGPRFYELLSDAAKPLFALGYGIVIAAAIRSQPWGARWPWAVRLGLASYGLYLIHPVVVAFMVKENLAPIPHDTLIAFVVNTAVVTAFTVALALASWRWLEQPALRLSRNLGERRRARSDAVAHRT